MVSASQALASLFSTLLPHSIVHGNTIFTHWDTVIFLCFIWLYCRNTETWFLQRSHREPSIHLAAIHQQTVTTNSEAQGRHGVCVCSCMTRKRPLGARYVHADNDSSTQTALSGRNNPVTLHTHYFSHYCDGCCCFSPAGCHITTFFCVTFSLLNEHINMFTVQMEAQQC